MADNELGFLQKTLQDEELAQAIADADNAAGVTILLRSNNRLLAITLWRHRIGADLTTAVDAVIEIEREIER